MGARARLFGEFDTEIGISGDRAVVVIRGELDVATAPTFGGFVKALCDHGHTDIVFDLEHLGFLDASGIGVFAGAIARLRPRGGRLILRSVPAPVRRVLELTGFSSMVDIEDPSPLAPEETDSTGPGTQEATEAPTTRDRFGALPASNDTIDAALRLVVSLASATISGADGVSVCLHRHGQILTAAASDETVLEMDRNQYATGEGPCLSAAAEGQKFLIDALANETRWPTFVPRAIKEGIASILSSPLMAEGRPIGALNIYSRAEGAFGPAEEELAALFAKQASGILADGGADISEEEASSRIRAALVSRMVIAQAQGILMERQGISAGDAAAILNRSSRSDRQTVLEQALSVIDSSGVPGDPDVRQTRSSSLEGASEADTIAPRG